MLTLTMSNKGWVVIPAELRRKYRLKPGSQVCIVDYGGVLSLAPAFEDAVQQAAGMLKGAGPLTEVLLNEHQREMARER